jgi:hypothetical protein
MFSPQPSLAAVVGFMIILSLLAGCQQPASTADAELAQLKTAMIRKTEQLRDIHLRLNSALTEISKAETTAQSGNCSDAQYIATDAYDHVARADDAILEMGAELQEMFNLDVAIANQN